MMRPRWAALAELAPVPGRRTAGQPKRIRTRPRRRDRIARGAGVQDQIGRGADVREPDRLDAPGPGCAGKPEQARVAECGAGSPESSRVPGWLQAGAAWSWRLLLLAAVIYLVVRIPRVSELEIMRRWRGAAVGFENWVPRRWCARIVAGGGSPGVAGWRRGGRKVHSCAGVPSVVSVCLWTVRGRELDCCRSPLPGNPRCCCVRVCQSPVLMWGSGGRRACPIGGGCRCGRWPGA